MFKPVNEPVRLVAGQVEALRNLPARERSSPEQQERQEIAIECTAILLGGFRKCDADDPEIYSRSIEHVLARYDADTQRTVTLPGKWKFPPSAYELREACEAIANERARAREREENRRKQLEERRRLDTLQAQRKALPAPPRKPGTAHLTIDELDRREAQQIPEAFWGVPSRRPSESSVFELDPENWNS